MKNLVKSLCCVGVAIASSYIIAKHYDKHVDEQKEKMPVVEIDKNAIKKAIMIAGGASVVYMISTIRNNRKEISRLWDMMEVDKILWADRLYKDGVLDEITKNKSIMECVNHINDDNFRNAILKSMEVK